MNNIKGKILSKSPCNSDLFEGQAHQKLANVIADEIKNDQKCTIIGIDGGWGSGKSNLVGMVENALTDDKTQQKSNKFHFFTYDAWGHQNDLPRRSILEELTSFVSIGANAILDEQYWKIRLENLLAKKKRTSTKIVPSLNFAVVTISLLVALTPVIASINSIISKPYVRLIFSGLVYLIAIIFVIYKQIKNMKKHNQHINCETLLTELFLLYKDKVQEDEKFETISEREPSTKQFMDWMYDINKDLKNKDKYLIIVIDNMDRLPKLKVQELWSAIHSFFSETQYSNIRVIVPFDRSHIRNAFQSEDITKNNDEQKPDDNRKIVVYGDDFINKTFYIVYHVAPPILSGWKDYFEKQWRRAFGEDSTIDNAVLQVYDLMTKEHTPRKIVAFVDEFVTIKSVSDELIPDRYIALFIFGRYALAENPIKEILTPSYLESLDFLYKEDKEMPKYMSSLYYQLPINNAMDVIYTREFTRELDENRLDSIKTLKDSDANKFKAIMERSLADVTNTNNAALTLESLFNGDSNTVINNFWNCLYQKDKTTRNEITQYLPYHKILLTHIADKIGYYKDLIYGYHKSLNEKTDIYKYTEGIDELASIEGFDIYSRLIKVKKEILPDQFISIVEEKKNNYKRYGLTCSNNILSKHLAGQDIQDWESLKALPFLEKKEYPLKSFITAIEAQLGNANLNSANAEILFTRLKELKNDDLINYRQYFSDEQLWKFYSDASDNFKADLVAMRLSSLDNYGTTYFNTIINNIDEDFVARIAKVIGDYCHYGDLLLGLESFPSPLLQAVCKYLTVHKLGVQRMSIKEVACKFDVIIDKSNITEDELFTRMNDWNTSKERIAQKHITDLPLSFFETAQRHKNELSAYVIELANSYLASLNQEEWEQYLQQENNFQLHLLKIYHPEKIQPFFDAFKRLMKGYATGEIENSLSIDTVNDIIAISNDVKHDISRLFRDLRDLFLTSSINAPQLRYFGQWMFDYANLDKKDGCLEKILPSELLDDTTIIEYMSNHKEIIKIMVDNSSDPSEFNSKLQSMLEGSRKDNENFKNLCSYLGIKIQEEDNSEEEVLSKD